jgi:predicted O-methyltransferase YrrM
VGLRLLPLLLLPAVLLSCTSDKPQPTRSPGPTDGQRPDPRAAGPVIPGPRLAKEDWDAPAGGDAARFNEKYELSEDWFSWNIPIWRKALEPYKGRADVRYLEIGLFEGRSVLWMIENILTHPTSKLTGIDPFASNEGDFRGEKAKKRYLSNLDKSNFKGQATTIVGYSQRKLRELPLESFDIIYIDGAHEPAPVLSDAVQSWELLAKGGILIFDDYLWNLNLPSDTRPKAAIDVFYMLFQHRIEVVHAGYQVILRKTS